MIFYLLVITVISLATYYYVIYPQKHWHRKQVKCLEPVFLFGNFLQTILLRKSMPEIINEFYNEIKNTPHRYIGIYQFNQPILLVKDLDLIKKITVKDFEHFMDHRSFSNAENDPMFGKNLFSLCGKPWKDMRSTLSPAFTGSKMKSMFPLIVECADRFCSFFETKIKQNGRDFVEIEAQSMITRLTNDIIASVAFGIQCDSLNNPDNEFYKMGVKIANFNSLRVFVVIMLNFLAPKLTKILPLKLFEDRMTNYFKEIILETIKMREEKNIVRSDMIHLLMEARKGKLKSEDNNNNDDYFDKENDKVTTLSDDDIVAQALIFFVAGFDTSSTLMAFILYEMAINPDIQARLQEEIDDVNEITYDSIVKMKYLEMVINETLRKWPPGSDTDRVCIKEYKIEPEENNETEKSVTIEKGIVISIPIYGIHRDENYYANPDKFDPERFNDENKKQIPTNAFIPFGTGPRNCIGSRFALLEIKTTIIKIFKKFSVIATEKTEVPLQLKKASLTTTAANGFFVALKLRNK